MPISIKLGLLFSAIVIPLTLYRKLSDPQAQSGFFGGIRTSAIIFITTLLVFSLTPWLLENAYRYLTDPTYNATVIDIKQKEGENGPMYSKVFRFTDEQGETHKIVSSLSSGGKPTIGIKEKIKYADGILLELSLAAILLTMGGLLVLHIFSLFPLYYLFYATGQNHYAVLNYGAQFAFKVLIPLGMALFSWAFIYNLWLGFTGAKEIPIWAMFVMSIFSFFLLVGLSEILKMFWGEEAKNNPLLQIGKKI